jgi:hypothetical protein
MTNKYDKKESAIVLEYKVVQMQAKVRRSRSKVWRLQGSAPVTTGY